jgi:hypothetical protein
LNLLMVWKPITRNSQTSKDIGIKTSVISHTLQSSKQG